MSLLAPAGLWLLLLAPLIVALHLWRVRYRRHTLSSTLLWSRVLAERPLQRPRRLPNRYLLLLLELAVLACAALALARPSWAVARSHRHVLVAIDTSLPMTATDVRPNRLARAREQAGQVIDTLGDGDVATLVDAGPAPRVLATGGDRAALHRALDALTPGYGSSALARDLPLLSGLHAAAGPGDEAYLFAPLGTPAATQDALRRALRGAHIALIGASADDRGVDELTVSCLDGDNSGGSRGRGARASPCEAYAQLVNTGTHAVTTRVTATIDGAATSQQVTLPAQSSVPIHLELARTTRTLELRLDGHDALPADDAAWAVVPLARPAARSVLLVTGDASSPLAQVLGAIPSLHLTTTTPDDTTIDDKARRADLTVLDSTDGSILPGGNLLVIDPPTGNPFYGTGNVVAVNGVTAVDAGSLLVRGADLSSLILTTIVHAQLPSWAHADVMSDGGPLLYSGTTGGRRVAVLTFDPRTTMLNNPSNLDTLLAFPTLLRNAVESLVPAATTSTMAGRAAVEPLVRPGQNGGPVRLQPLSTADVGPAQPAQSDDGSALDVPAVSDIVALPPLRPGLYALDDGPGNARLQLAANAAVAGNPATAADTAEGAAAEAAAPAPAAPALLSPDVRPPWEGWALLAMLALIVLSAEWWYYARRT